MLLAVFSDWFKLLCTRQGFRWFCEALGLVSYPKQLYYRKSSALPPKQTSIAVYQELDTEGSLFLTTLLEFWPWSVETSISLLGLVFLIGVWGPLFIRNELLRTRAKLLRMKDKSIDPLIDDYSETWNSEVLFESKPLEQGAGERASRGRRYSARKEEKLSDDETQRRRIIKEATVDDEDTFSSETFNEPGSTNHACQIENFASLFNVLKVISIEKLSQSLFLLRCVEENLRLRVRPVERHSTESIEQDLRNFRTLRNTDYCDHGLYTLPDIRHVFYLTDSMDKLNHPHQTVSGSPPEQLMAIAWLHEEEISIIRFLSENTSFQNMETLLDQLFVAIGVLETISQSEGIVLVLPRVAVSLLPCDRATSSRRNVSTRPTGVRVKFNPQWLEAGILLEEVPLILDFYLEKLDRRGTETIGDGNAAHPHDVEHFYQCRSLISALRASIDTNAENGP